ncbi:NADH-quinone oxidoreductase subunit K [Bradyrhizobium diazoefficiens]
MPTSTHTTTEPSPSSGPRKRSVNAVSKAAVSLSSDSGCYGLITKPQPLRKIIAFNLLGSGVFLLFGVVGRRGAAAGIGNDPVPQALVITGIVVAFSATRFGDCTAAAAVPDECLHGAAQSRLAAR